MLCPHCGAAEVVGRWCPACLRELGDNQAPADGEQTDAAVKPPMPSLPATEALPPVADPAGTTLGAAASTMETDTEAELRFCPRCGGKLPGGARHCGICGARVFAVQAPVPRLAHPAGGSRSFVESDGSASYSGWWRRVWAQLIDTVAVLVLIVLVVIGVALIGALIGAPYQVGVALFGAFAIWSGYFIYFHGKTGQTWGKRAMGIRVGDVKSGKPIGYGRATGRWASMVLLFGTLGAILIIVPYLNLLSPLWDKQHQAWHDKLVSSTVFRSRFRGTQL